MAISDQISASMNKKEEGVKICKVAMDNNQSIQDQPSEESESWLAQSSRRQIVLSARLNSLLELIKHRPRLVLSGTWVFLVAIAAIAALSLAHTNREEQASQPTAVAAENPAKTSSQMGSPMPLWLLGSVALTFGAGSLVIYKQLNRSSRRQHQHIQNSSAPVLTHPTEREGSSLEPMMPVSAAVGPLMRAETESGVMVLPPEESDRHDLPEESLAEMMDIRKQLSLSSILAQPLKK